MSSDPSDSHNPSMMPPAAKGRPGAPAPLPHIDVFEKGAKKDGVPQTLNDRLFMQLLVVTQDEATERVDPAALCSAVEAAGIGAVVYDDLNDPRGYGVLTFSRDPADFITKTRPIFARPELSALRVRPEMTMIGRSYSTGYEPDLADTLLERPKRNVLNAELPWHVWYPLRRTGAFEQLEGRDKGGILREHATIGRAYGAQELANDVRLACHGLDTNDNEFVIGLVGKTLHPLSHLVQRMRGTKQTSQYIAKMGPFFVGHALARFGGAE